MSLNLGAAIAAISSIRTDLAQRTGCPEWDNGGIRAALIATEGAPADVMAAACLAAGDRSLQYPSERALRMHWPKNASAAPRVSHDVTCPEHPQHVHPCPDCTGARTRQSPEEVAAGAAVVRSALAVAPTYRSPAARAAARNQEAQP